MAVINKRFFHFATEEKFEAKLSAGAIPHNAIVFIHNTQRIWTHGGYYDNRAYVSGLITAEAQARTKEDRAILDKLGNVEGVANAANTRSFGNESDISSINAQLSLVNGSISGMSATMDRQNTAITNLWDAVNGKANNSHTHTIITDLVSNQGDSDCTDNTEFVTGHYSGYSTTNNKTYRRKASFLWNYIKSKIESVLGLTPTYYLGTASSADSATYAGEALYAASAESATQDGSGNVITSTYVLKSGDASLAGTFSPKTNKGANLGTSSNRFNNIFGTIIRCENLGVNGNWVTNVRAENIETNDLKLKTHRLPICYSNFTRDWITFLDTIRFSNGCCGSIYINPYSATDNPTYANAPSPNKGASGASWYTYQYIPHLDGANLDTTSTAETTTYGRLIMIPMAGGIGHTNMYQYKLMNKVWYYSGVFYAHETNTDLFEYKLSTGLKTMTLAEDTYSWMSGVITLPNKDIEIIIVPYTLQIGQFKKIKYIDGTSCEVGKRIMFLADRPDNTINFYFVNTSGGDGWFGKSMTGSTRSFEVLKMPYGWVMYWTIGDETTKFN